MDYYNWFTQKTNTNLTSQGYKMSNNAKHWPSAEKPSFSETKPAENKNKVANLTNAKSPSHLIVKSFL